MRSYPTYDLRRLTWKGEVVPDYVLRADGVLFDRGMERPRWQINGHNYSTVYIGGQPSAYRLDYMIAYTYFGTRDDTLRLIHLDGNQANDHADNLMWYCKSDIPTKYIDLAIQESDGTIEEQWKLIYPKFSPDLGYEVSIFGRIRDAEGHIVPLRRFRGLQTCTYIDDVGIPRTITVYRAVAQAFIPNPKGLVLVKRLDGNRSNDEVFNLAWTTNGTIVSNQWIPPKTPYTSKQIRAVGTLLEEHMSSVQIEGITGVDRKTISDIYREKTLKKAGKIPEKA